MFALISLLFIVTISILIVRIASSALVMTGVSRDVARFQARSALSGTGFTTPESEQVVDHPVRRRIITALIMLQNAGLVTAVSALILSFVNTESTTEVLHRVVLLLAGLGVLFFLAQSTLVDRGLSRLIEWALSRYTNLEVIDYYALLKLEHSYGVGRVEVAPDSWLAGKTLADLDLTSEGVLILGILRSDGSYVGAPRGRYTVNVGEVLTLYGKQDRIAELKERVRGASGERTHEQAADEHQDLLQRQDREEERYQSVRDEVRQAESV